MLIINKCLKSSFSLLKVENKVKEQKVYSVHASAILFSSSFFNSGGWFDDNFELYGEELSVSEIAKKISIPIHYVPKLKIMHHEHTSTKKTNKRLLFDKARKSYHYINSNYLKK
jgi:GT2 family glycosyltransferase